MSITEIPLNQLVASPSNVRKTGGRSIEDLAASIKANGLLQNLTVVPAAKGKEGAKQYEVVAGGRRYRALLQLLADGEIEKAHPVPCTVRERAEATELGLAENTIREAMHPADQFEAFKALADGGMSPADIAARFGCGEDLVGKRLTLARVSPKLLEAYRKEEMNLETVMAFTLTDDHKRQEQLFKELKKGGGLNPNWVRRCLTETKIGTDHRAVKFVGMEEYEAAGGTVTRDLFSTRDEGYLDDPELLSRLATEKLEAEANSLRGDGWKWVEVMLEIPYLGHGDYRQFYGKKTKEVKAATGAIVGIAHDGKLKIETGVVRKGDRMPGTKEASPGADAPKEKPDLSAAVVADMTGRRTQALRAMLAQNPEVALLALVHRLALERFYQRTWDSCLQAAVTVQYLGNAIGSHAERETKAHAELARLEAQWREYLPEKASGLWGWLQMRGTETHLELLAFLIAPGVNALLMNPRAEAHRHSHALARALKLDMADWWEPTAANYLARVSKDKVVDALAEAGEGAQMLAAARAMKKVELAASAEKALKGKRWLPEALKLPDPANDLIPDDEDDALLDDEEELLDDELEQELEQEEAA